MEILNPNATRGRFTHALFDFDGTISLIREGWQNIMAPMFTDILADLKTGESKDDLSQVVREWMMRLTGKQTIYQMLELCEQIRLRGGTPMDPLHYKFEYLSRLERRIEGRIAELESGRTPAERWLVPGVVEFLQGLKSRGVILHLASGTDVQFVRREAKLLGVADLFEGRISGAVDDYKAFSKRIVLDRILSENKLKSEELVSVGDGYVEIENAKQVGAYALGVASLEAAPGEMDIWKRDRLTLAGADAIIPHFAQHGAILEFLFPKANG